MKKRIDYFDLIKLVAMLLVCISHCIQRTIPGVVQTKLFDVFYSLHMALFMFVGGVFTTKSDTIKELIKGIGKRFLNYIYSAVVFTILSVLLIQTYSTHDLIYWLKELVCRTDTFYWYLISAFVIETILSISYFISRKIIKHRGIGTTITSCLLSLVLSVVLIFPLIICFDPVTIGVSSNSVSLSFFGEGNYTLGPDFLALDLTLFYFPIALVGYVIGIFVEQINNHKNIKYIRNILFVLFFGIYILGISKLDHWVTNSNYSLTDFLFIKYIAVALCGVFAIYYLCLLLCKNRFFSNISQFGQYSLSFYLVHVFILRWITPFVSKIPQDDYSLYNVCFVISYALIITLGTMLLSIALAKTPYLNLLLFGDMKSLKNTYPQTEKSNEEIHMTSAL